MAIPMNPNNKMTTIELAASFGIAMVASIFTSANPLIGGCFFAIVKIIEKIVEPIFQGLLKNFLGFIGAFIITNAITKISLCSAIVIDIFGSLVCLAVIIALIGSVAIATQRQNQQSRI